MSKKDLAKALEHTDKLSDDWFGKETIAIEDLPSVAIKNEIVRTSSYLRKKDLEALKKISKETKVPVAQLQGDIVSVYLKSLQNHRS